MRTTLPLLAALVGLAAGAAALRGQEDEDPAVRAARARREAAKTVLIEYEQVDEFVKDAGPGVAADKIILKSVNKLVLDGEKTRYENNHPNLELPSRKIRNHSSVSVYDGSLGGDTIFPNGIAGQGQPQGIIQKGPAELFFIKDFAVLPLWMAFRGDDPAVCGYPVSKLKPSKEVLSLDGAECKEYRYQYQDSPPKKTESIWLDPARDYLPRRIGTPNEGRSPLSTDVTYRKNDAGRWVPASWVITHYYSLTYPQVTTTVTVLKLEINVPQPAEQFEVQFPPGAFVSDYRNGRELPPAPNPPLELIPRGLPVKRFFGDRYAPWILGAVVVLCLTAGILYVMRKKKTTPD
jgi:hypothetical protein